MGGSAKSVARWGAPVYGHSLSSVPGDLSEKLSCKVTHPRKGGYFDVDYNIYLLRQNALFVDLQAQPTKTVLSAL